MGHSYIKMWHMLGCCSLIAQYAPPVYFANVWVVNKKFIFFWKSTFSWQLDLECQLTVTWKKYEKCEKYEGIETNADINTI